MGQQLMRKSGEVVKADKVLEDKKIICFYFSSHWCPPCRDFTPILADFYSVRIFTIFFVGLLTLRVQIKVDPSQSQLRHFNL